MTKLLARLLGLLEYFCGPHPSEDDLTSRSKLLNEIVATLINTPLMTVGTASHGELMSLIRKGLTVPCKPASKHVTLHICEELAFIMESNCTYSIINGMIMVDNPLANDLMMELKPVIPLTAQEHVPWEWDESAITQRIPLQLGRYRLADYTHNVLPFTLKLEGDRVVLVWKSWGLAEGHSVKKARIILQLSSSVVPSLSLDPPTLAHSASYSSQKGAVEWRFTHLVPSTQYVLRLPGAHCTRANLEFELEGTVISNQTLTDLRIYQESTGISAEHQLQIHQQSKTLSKYCLMQF